MPPQKAMGSLLAEEHLARRIELERTRRGWSYEGLAKRVTDAGCPIQPSAIHKIEKGSPRRRITVDEAIAYALVFEIPVDNLLVPPNVASKTEFRETWSRLRETSQARLEAQNRHRAEDDTYASQVEMLMNRLGELAQLDPDVRDIVGELVAGDAKIHPTKAAGVADSWLQVLDHYSQPENRG